MLDCSEELDLPDATSIDDVKLRLARVCAKLEQGRLETETADSLIRGYSALAKIMKDADLENRIELLEKKRDELKRMEGQH